MKQLQLSTLQEFNLLTLTIEYKVYQLELYQIAGQQSTIDQLFDKLPPSALPGVAASLVDDRGYPSTWDDDDPYLEAYAQGGGVLI